MKLDKKILMILIAVASLGQTEAAYFSQASYSRAASHLGVNANASIDQIKKAFREQIKKAHPDLGGSKEESQKLNEAYEYLKSNYKSYNDIFSNTGQGLSSQKTSSYDYSSNNTRSDYSSESDNSSEGFNKTKNKADKIANFMTVFLSTSIAGLFYSDDKSIEEENRNKIHDNVSKNIQENNEEVPLDNSSSNVKVVEYTDHYNNLYPAIGLGVLVALGYGVYYYYNNTETKE